MNAIITIEQYKTLLGINNVPPPQIPIVETLIRVVSDMIENMLGYDLELQDRLEKINKNIKISRLWVKYPPITEVTEFNINEKVIDPNSYMHTKHKIEFSDGFCECNCGCTYTTADNIEITYKSGYVFGENGTVPFDLQFAVARMVQSLIMIQQDPDMIKFSTYKINDIAYSYKDAERHTSELILIPALKGLMLWQ